MPGPGDAQQLTKQGWRPFLATVYVIVALLLGSNLPNSLFPLYARDFHLSPLDITLIFATYTLLVIPSLIFFAPLSDARGRRGTLGAAIVVAAVAAGLFAAASSASWLYAAQAVQALALGALQGTAAPALVEADPTGNVRRSTAIASAAVLAGAAIGPVLAAATATSGSLGPRLPYLVEIGLLLLALICVRILPAPRQTERWQPRRPQIPRGIRRPFVIATTAAFVGWSVTGLFLALIPSFVTTVLHEDLLVAGGVLALMLGCSALVAGFAHRLSSLSMQVLGISGMGVGVAGLFAAAAMHSLAALLATTVVAGVGQGLTFMGSLADVNEIAPVDRKANVVASYFVVVYVGTAVPVIGVGALAGPLGLVAAINIFAAVIAVVCVVGLGFLLRELHARGRQGHDTDLQTYPSPAPVASGLPNADVAPMSEPGLRRRNPPG